MSATLVVAPTVVAKAADADDFDPGFLISDADFFNGSALSATQVDSFIKGINKGCATGKTCIENYRENITAKSATSRCSAIPAATNRTAGQIIAAVGKACGISPKAILVILQKEQSLVTATAPSSRAFAYAMGAGCPDSTGCTTPYKGLYAQVYYGASLLKGYTLPSSSNYARYAAGKVSAIKYHPKASCGTKSVRVKNQATHALYVYTPYTPNAKALANLYSTGDSCSSYGNRNFWRMYTDWWGPTGSAGAIAIDEKYSDLGGSTGSLGARVGSLVTSTAAGQGLYQQYAKGTIAWSSSDGAHLIGGALAPTWAARVGEFGWPTADIVTTSAAGGGTYQTFDNTILAQSGGGKVYTVWGATRAYYLKSGGPAGPMGWPTAFQVKDSTGLYTQAFSTGTSYRKSASTGFVTSALVAAYNTRGGTTGSLGWPTGLATSTDLRGGGTVQAFEKGSLFSSSFGTHAVYGTTLAKFNALGGVSRAGWPIGGRVAIEGTDRRRQDFEKGTIVTKGSTSAWVATALVPEWTASGFDTGSVGAQTHNPVVTTANGGGAYQGFKKATLVRQGDKKTYKLVGIARTAWAATSREQGVLGWPIANAKKDSTLKLTVQNFQTGVLIHDSKRYAVVGTNEWALAKKLGVGTGKLGWPTSEVRVRSAAGGGEYQKFANGAITWRERTGAIYVSKTFYSAWVNAGGVAGALGWPTAASKTDTKTGKVTQAFDGGVISWTKAKGATVSLSSK